MNSTSTQNMLPPGWTLAELRQLVDNPQKDIVDGPFGSNLRATEYTESGIPVLKIQNIKPNKFIDKNIKYITEKKANDLSRHSFVSGDLIVTKLGKPLGLCCKIPNNLSYGIIVADLIRIRISSDKVFDKYLVYSINSYIVQSQFKAITKGTTRPRVNLTIVRKIKIPYPSPSEQHQIVSKIEELFSELDNGIESLKKAREQLKTYRQAVLKHAFEGKLTAEWSARQIAAGTPPEPAEKLLERIRQEREGHYQAQLGAWKNACVQAEAQGAKSPPKPKKPKEVTPLTEKELAELPELPKGWGWVKSGNLFLFVTSGSRGWAKYYSSIGSIFIRIENLNFDTIKIDLTKDNIQFVNPPSGTEGTRTKTEKGDFLFSITGYLGMFAIAPFLESAYINQHIALARPFSLFRKNYIGYYCIAKTGGYFYLNKNQKGATKAGLTLDDIRNFPIPLCPISEQDQIISEIETRLSVCDQLEQIIEGSLKKSEALRQSILKKAFEGELTREWRERHPELVSGENSAEKLLERIKAEKARQGSDGKRQRMIRAREK